MKHQLGINCVTTRNEVICEVLHQKKR